MRDILTKLPGNWPREGEHPDESLEQIALICLAEEKLFHGGARAGLITPEWFLSNHKKTCLYHGVIPVTSNESK
jgi:hypothetical protein